MLNNHINYEFINKNIALYDVSFIPYKATSVHYTSQGMGEC